jgi:hypothetical protein
MIDAVVSHHMNPFRSGVARFNELLAEQLGVPCVSLHDAGSYRAPLLSFKVSELRPEDAAAVEAALDAWPEPELFLHEWHDSALEHRLLQAARRVLCGNHEIALRLQGAHPVVEELWTPGLIVENGRIAPVDLRVFTFGMAHKIRADHFRRLRSLLEATGRSYAVRVSAANHETATLGDAQSVFEEMREIFPDRLYFLGNLSDLAILDELDKATLFAAFFRGGVRANNTSVASAMERGAVVVTNLDEGSPQDLHHMENVLDINQLDVLPDDPLVLRRIGIAAMERGRERSWDRLVARLRA